MSTFPHAVEVSAAIFRRPGARGRTLGFDDECRCASVAFDPCVVGHGLTSPSIGRWQWAQQRGFDSGTVCHAGRHVGGVPGAELGEENPETIDLVEYQTAAVIDTRGLCSRIA